MTKYNELTKKKFIELMNSNGHSTYSAAKELNISRPVAQRWWTMYKVHGYKGLVMKSKKYDGEFKLNVIKYMHDNHLSYYDVSAKFGIPSDSTLRKWERIYYEQGEEGLLKNRQGRPRKTMSNTKNNDLSKEKEEDLIAEVQRLRAEVAYLKKYNALVQKKKDLKTRKKQK